MCEHTNESGRFCVECMDDLCSRMGITTTAPEEPVDSDLDCTHPEQCMYESGYGTLVCMCCGIEKTGGPLADPSYTYPRGYEITIRRKQPYTRAKRFRKYLTRACMSQGLSSVPDATWAYLVKHLPYAGPQEILFRLKRSKLKNKCYDSLPIMTKHMCPQCRVPILTPQDAQKAVCAFNEIESGFPKGSKFVSYLYLLEHVLVRIGRKDMLPFLNRIQCPRRRREYEERIRFSHHSNA
jgi:hypothetical protein